MEDIKIPTMATSSAIDREQDLKKQMGCMNGILQLFDRHHFIMGRGVRSHSHERLLQGGQQGPKKMEKGPDPQKEKPRMSTESSRASCSSSTCSTSTFSSVDCNKIVQPETLFQGQISISEIPFQTIATKERQPPCMKTIQSLDLQDIVKDSMYREARCLSIKHLAADEMRGTVMKHIDSPRPSQQFNPVKPKATGYEGSPQVIDKDKDYKKNSKEEHLACPRFSYDGRESRETTKWGMKHKEPPRLSLDIKSSSLKTSACEARSRFPGQHRCMENESTNQALPSNQQSESHHRPSSIVVKLMGLETLQDTISSDLSSCPKEAFLTTPTADKSRQNKDTYSPHVPKSNPGTLSPRLHNANYVRKLTTCSKLPAERAPWRQQDHTQGSPKLTSQSRKATTSASHPSSSVYSEIEKRITELEFNQSGKDLRALKQILEAMEKMRERLENRRGESAELTLLGNCSLEDNYSSQNYKLLMQEKVQNYHQVRTFKGPCLPRSLGSSYLIMKPTKMMDRVNLSTQAPTMEISPLQRLPSRVPMHHREISVHKTKGKHFAQRNSNVKDSSRYLPAPCQKTAWRGSEVRKTSAGPHCMTVENCTNSGRSFGMAGPILRKNSLGIGEECHPTTTSPLLDSHGFRKQSSKKLIAKSPQHIKHKGKAKDLQLNDEQLSELSSETRCSSHQGDIASVKSESNNSQLSQTETEALSMPSSTYASARKKEKAASIRRENTLAVENVATLLEQPSPSSVLDGTFYIEDSPSPVKKASTSLQDESSSLGQAAWDLKNSKHLAAYRKNDHKCRHNQKLENTKHSACELSVSHDEPDKIAATDSALANGSCNPDHRYIMKILLTSGLLKDSNFFSKTDDLPPSCHLINPDIFHVLEQTEGIMDLKGEVTEKNANTQLNKKLQRRIVFDIVDEILVRKIHSGRYAGGKKSTSPQGLLEEVYLEMDSLCRISDCNLDNATLTADMSYQSEDWADYSGEFPALVLDIERHIFKGLINEVIAGEVTGIQDRPKRHCRQLFSH